jgi:poly-gamma-glutamate capsule biosynthesis protein CapA/YwtB (metallophosphatase superfamily)
MLVLCLQWHSYYFQSNAALKLQYTDRRYLPLKAPEAMGRDKILLGLAGDVMIGRGVDRAIAQKGYDYPWGNVLPLIRSTDINLVNLETTLTHSTKAVFKTFNFKATPDKVQTLTRARITAVSLANNHILDFDTQGLYETIQTLKAAGILYTGAGANDEEAARPALITKNGFTLGLLSYTDNEPGWKAGAQKCGVNYMDIGDSHDTQRALGAVQRLRPGVNLLVVSLHWGPNLCEEPPTYFSDFAHQLIEQGADIIHGHSAHVCQGIEVYRNRLILYDTGDFIDDYIVHTALRNDLSFFFLVHLTPNTIESLQLVPVLISNCTVNRATGSEQRWAIKRIQELSAPFGTTISDDGVVLISQTHQP